MLNENDAPCIKEQEPNATNVRNHTTNTTPKEFKNKGSPHDPNNHNRSTIRNQNKLKKHGIPYVKEQESTAIHVQNCTTNTMPKKFKDKDNPYDVNNHNPSTIHNQNRLKKHGIPYVKEQESTAIHVQNCTTNTMPKKFKDKDNPYDVNNNNPSTIHKQNKLEKNDITFVNAAHVQNRQPRHPNKPNENQPRHPNKPNENRHRQPRHPTNPKPTHNNT